MTTEDDFQAALDANPEDWQTRLVFADWLQERADPRAEGYRALGVQRVWPWHGWWIGKGNRDLLLHIEHSEAEFAVSVVPCDWFAELRDGREQKDHGHEFYWRKYTTRRQADDDAARAFAQLPAARRAELITEPTETPRTPVRAKPKKKPTKRKRKT
jgi:uncharacterized protein (TIGR02996 family)